MPYIEIFVAPVPTDRRDDYEALSATMAQIHKDHGALSVTECWGSDVPPGQQTSFPLAVALEEGETVVAGWIVWPSKDIRDTAFEKAMSDPRMQQVFDDMPLDGKRLIFGGFERILEM